MIWFMVNRFDIGEASIVVLGIASIRRDFDQLSEIFPSVEKDRLGEAFRAAQPEGAGRYLDWSFNSVLIRACGRTILVDTGFGFSDGGPGAGMAQLLNECGLRPEEVDTIMITHGHPDHIGGLIQAGAPAMPGARVVISRKEFEFWMEGQAERLFGAEGSSAQQSTFSICRSQIDCVDMDTTILESADTVIRALPSPGHTPGHIGIDVLSQGHRLWLLVDTLHAPFQLGHPDWSPRFDVNPESARVTRRRLLTRSAELEQPVHLYHFPFPGLGKIVKAGDLFFFEPIRQ